MHSTPFTLRLQTLHSQASNMVIALVDLKLLLLITDLIELYVFSYGICVKNLKFCFYQLHACASNVGFHWYAHNY